MLSTVAASAFHEDGASCLLAVLLEMCGMTLSATRPVLVVDDIYPYPTRAEDFYPRLHCRPDGDRKI